MADEGFSKEEFENLKKHYKDIAALTEKAREGLVGYNEILKKIKDIARDINHTKQQEAKIGIEIEKEIKKRERLLARINSKEEENTEEVQKQLAEYEKAILARQKGLKYIRAERKALEDNAKVLSETANSSNLLAASFKSVGKGVGGLFRGLKDVGKELMKEQKAVQQTELSMGILSKQSHAFRMNMFKAATSSSQLGISAGELAKMQGAYSEQIGRSVQLSEQGLSAMAEMASGTMLGAEGAAEMAAGMDSFGVSAIGARDRVEEMMNLSSKMGVNSTKVTKNLLMNMKLANKLHFKDGVKGMIRLAASAAKLHLDMEGIAGMAKKVFRPEGAVKMAAELQTMGGEFAKLGEPFQLMFKARNDFEGFANDIGNATKEFTKFNSETGEFEISGLMMDRMDRISEITGIGADKLAEMGKQAAKIAEIEMHIGGGMDTESTAFISSIAQFNESTGEWEAYFDGQNQSIDKLNKIKVQELIAEKQTLKERAKQAQTFDDTWKNLINSFKTVLLPFLDGISEGLKEPLHNFMEWSQKGGLKKMFGMAEKLGKNVSKFLKGAGKIAQTVAEFIADNPLSSLVIALGTIGLFKFAQWYSNGKFLAMGFNSSASVGGGAGGGSGRRGGGMLKGLSGMMGGKKSMAGRGLRNMAAKRGGAGGGFKGRGGAGAGMAGMAAAIGLEYMRSQMDDPDSTEGKLAGIGSSAATGAAMGSIVPGWGTAIGGAAGAVYGGFNETKTEKKGMIGQQFDDVIMRSGQAPIGINPADDVLSMKKGGPVDKALDKTGGGSGSSNMTFGPINITGSLELTGAGIGTIDLDDPILMRDLSKTIQEEVRRAVGGGKLNPNPL